MAKTILQAQAVLDYPKENEIITTPHYTFRIGTAQNTDLAEISIDRGQWQVCRHSVGYWWYDWTGYKAGEHQVVVRIRIREGQTETLPARRFRVELQASEQKQALPSSGARTISRKAKP